MIAFFWAIFARIALRCCCDVAVRGLADVVADDWYLMVEKPVIATVSARFDGRLAIATRRDLRSLEISVIYLLVA